MRTKGDTDNTYTGVDQGRLDTPASTDEWNLPDETRKAKLNITYMRQGTFKVIYKGTTNHTNMET